MDLLDSRENLNAAIALSKAQPRSMQAPERNTQPVRVEGFVHRKRGRHEPRLTLAGRMHAGCCCIRDVKQRDRNAIHHFLCELVHRVRCQK